MKITKRGKCLECEARVTETCDFMVNVDMFDPNPKTELKGPLLDEIKKVAPEENILSDPRTGRVNYNREYGTHPRPSREMPDKT